MTDTATEKLLSIACKSANQDREAILSLLAETPSGGIRGVYWDNFIPHELQHLWPSLPLTARLSAYLVAIDRQHDERLRS